MSIKSLETLEAWKKAKEFALRVYREKVRMSLWQTIHSGRYCPIWKGLF